MCHMPRLLSILLFTLASFSTWAQFTVRGRVTDQTGATVIGANIVVKDTPGLGTITDLDGTYSLKLERTTPVTLVFSFIGLSPQERIVSPGDGDVIVLNVTLKDASVELKVFEVEGKGRRSGDTHLDRLKANAPVSFDFISSDAIKKTGDADAAQAIRRVTGVSSVGAFVTVRGLADRYLVTTVNGARVPTLDPLTNNLRLDLFPTGLLDNIIITKTLSPDLPGDWAGAYMSLNTTDFPQQLQVSANSSIGYNTNATFQDIIMSQRSSTDWLGYDDGLRGIPDGVSAAVEDFPDFIEPNLYQQLGVLGLSSYLTSLGIVESTPGFQTTNMSLDNTLQHLALTELGLLGPAQLLDPNAVANAVSTYNTNYGLSYFSPILNAGLAEANEKFNNANWLLKKGSGRPNFSQSFSIGNQLELFKKSKTPRSLGYQFGVRYGMETEHDPASVQQRTGEAFDDPVIGDDFGREGSQALTVETHGWSAVGSLGLKLDRNNNFTLLVMPSRMGQNVARYQEFLNPGIGTEVYVSEDQFYEQRALWVYQYGSKHLIPALNLTVEADASFSDGERDLLDLRVLQYIKPVDGAPAGSDGALTQPGRIYRFMDESILDSRLSFELPLDEPAPNKARKLKFGAAYRLNERTNTQTYFAVRGAPGPTGWTDPGRFSMGPDGRFISLYTPFGTFKDNDIGILKVWAGYIMTDYALTPRWRLVTGARAELTDLTTDILRFYEQGVAADDPVRGTVGDLGIGGGANPEPKPARPGTIEQWDVLPSINIIHKLVDDEQAPMNLRFGYFRSLARPSFREFSVVQQFDFQLSSPVFGNPDLRMTRIDNFDVRVERFFANKNNLSLSGFYKRFTDHIELLYTAAGGYTWRNADLSEVVGAELEGRMDLAQGLELRGNLTWMYSRSDLRSSFANADGNVKYSTRMFGQAPWIVNTTLSYAPDSSGFSASASYNVQGPKLAITNSEVNPDGIRAYEMPRHMIDLTIGKKLGKHWGVTARARNLLNAPLRRTYLFNSGYDYDFDSYAWGTEYSLGISYAIR